jgi:hypothetical protein
MTTTTPTKAELLEGYIRAWRWREEQIGNGMPLSIPEVPERRYEVKNGGERGEDFVTS